MDVLPHHLPHRVQVTLRTSFFSCLALVALAAVPSLATAQDPFELEVFGPTIANPGETELGINFNYVSQGNTAFDGPFAPTEHQSRLSAELGHGLTKRIEVAAYALAAKQSDQTIDWAGWRLRTRILAPESWSFPVKFGVNVEVEGTNILYGEHEHTLEIAPIAGWKHGPLTVNVDLPFARALGGEGEQDFEFEPKIGANFAVAPRFTLTTMYFNSPEDAGGTGAKAARRQMFFPGFELLLGDDFRWNAGVGFGMSNTADDLVLRTGVEFPLHE